ncbi:MAG: type I 3-dehydroquinate dehydratase [Deltaproteobacteria bacterium]|nr:type I 3-dehydroquinate dehydratase [Deltaproteobacteria bacterium]
MICVSICASTQKKAMQDIRRVFNRCDLLELRMDEIADGNLVELINCIRGLSPASPVLVTYRKSRPSELGRITRMNESTRRMEDDRKRWEILREAVHLETAYVDVELEDDDEKIASLKMLIARKGRRTKLVCSHHNYMKTPSLAHLKNLYQACVAKGADVIKIVPYARAAEDNIRIFQFLAWASKQKKEVVAFCMGPKGRLSRVGALLFGSAFSFAALDEKSSAAPGQIGVKDMEILKEILFHEECRN